MSDEYWDHPSRRETKRLLDLGDAGAILDELQQGSTEWDDAREALGNLVRAADLRAAASEDTWRRWAEARVSDAKAEGERLRAELEEIRTTETDVTWLADGVRRLIDGVSIRTAKDPAHAQSIIAREAASLINTGILTAFVSSRVVDLSVDRIRQAEAERDDYRKALASLQAKALGGTEATGA